MPNRDQLWLSIDLSSQSGSLAVHLAPPTLLSGTGQPRLLAEVDLEDGGKHSESVIPALMKVLAAAETALPKIDRYITSTGPGSFTGLRIAFAAIKAFSLASQKPIELVSGHEARAVSYLDNLDTAPKMLWVATQITRDSFLLSEFQPEGRAVNLVGDTTVPTLPATESPLLTDKATAVGKTYPLHARQLAETLLRTRSRKTLHTWEEIAASAPHYFGSRNY